jgi:hypothetical protein
VSKLSFVLLLFTFRSLCLGQVMSQSNMDLPDAPRPQLASLFPKSVAVAITPDVNSTLPTINPIALESLEGTRVRLKLITPISSKSATGSLFRARIEEPIVSRGMVVLPQNTLFEGHVATKPARRVMKPGSVFMTFDRLILPNGSVQEVSLHLVSADSLAVKSDSEGILHPALSKKRLAIQVGGTALTAKFADDLAELAGGTAVGAGTARVIGAGAAATFLVLQKGREVKLRSGDFLDVEFGNPSHSLQDGFHRAAPTR